MVIFYHYLFVSRSVCPSVCPSVHVCISVCLSVCMCVQESVTVWMCACMHCSIWDRRWILVVINQRLAALLDSAVLVVFSRESNTTSKWLCNNFVNCSYRQHLFHDMQALCSSSLCWIVFSDITCHYVDVNACCSCCGCDWCAGSWMMSWQPKQQALCKKLMQCL